MKTVIEMAREAGWDDHHAEFDTRLKRFAELVRADERARMAEQPAQQQDADHDFKNFHRSLCERFNYAHDEKDWKRDLVSLEEWIAKKVQPEQEPVAIVSGYYGGQCVILPIDPARIFNSNTALYISPPPCPTCEALARTVMLDQTSHDAQRQWVGLTEEEHTQIAINCGCMSADWVFYGAAVERNLKEKNT